MPLYLLATLDTKGGEARYLRDELARLGVAVTLVDVGALGEPQLEGDIDRAAVFAAAGASVKEIAARRDRGEAVTRATEGARALVRDHFERGLVSGVIAMGGSAGTTIGTAAMRALPLGVPKLMVSTLASGEVRHYVGDKDILMLNSVVDIAGLNRITKSVLSSAARAMAGMLLLPRGADAETSGKPLIAATMFGVTTPCIEEARRVLEASGYEVLVFHATGSGGKAMESLIADGLIAGVLDITTTELADELVGGFLTAGPERLTAAGQRGVPQVVSVGATDMVNFHGPESVPARFGGRKFYQHNPAVTLMRTTAEECRRIGADIGAKLAAATGPAAIYFPRRGVSAIDRAGAAFDDPEARGALLSGLRETAAGVEIVELDQHINDPEFAGVAARRLIELMQSSRQKAN
ncbi:MAG: Tm-1-like ATP-binding domain-containing protein [Pirellulales bacterium]|nr:Tm-1-like ATP-binding domain-containing protein [Pirellulales bacterium]